MQVKLIAICNDFDNIKMPITPVIGLFSSVGCVIDSVCFLDADFATIDLRNNIKGNVVLLAPFDNEQCLIKIKSVLDKFQCNYQSLSYGYCLDTGSQKIMLLDSDYDYSKINTHQLNNIFGGYSYFSIKLFTDNQDKILQAINTLPDFSQFELAKFYDSGDMLLVFVSKLNNKESMAKFKQQIYFTFGDYIYNDESTKLVDTLFEVLSIYNKKVVFLDNTKEKRVQSIFTEFGAFSQNFLVADKHSGNSLAEISKFLNKNNGYIGVILEEGNGGIVLSIITEYKCKSEQIDFKSLQKRGKKYLFHYFLYQILQKIRKNSW